MSAQLEFVLFFKSSIPDCFLFLFFQHYSQQRNAQHALQPYDSDDSLLATHFKHNYYTEVFLDILFTRENKIIHTCLKLLSNSLAFLTGANSPWDLGQVAQTGGELLARKVHLVPVGWESDHRATLPVSPTWTRGFVCLNY